MKNILFLLFAVIAIIETPTQVGASSKADLFLKKSNPQCIIPKYKSLTTLECTSNGRVQELTQVCFEIKSGGQKIGQILLQYYPLAKAQVYSDSPAHTIRLRHIQIDEGRRQKGHAGRALETLFTTLCKNNLPESTEVWLECNKQPPYLIPFYEKFGFENTGTSPLSAVIYMKTKLNETKFPYYRK